MYAFKVLGNKTQKVKKRNISSAVSYDKCFDFGVQLLYKCKIYLFNILLLLNLVRRTSTKRMKKDELKNEGI